MDDETTTPVPAEPGAENAQPVEPAEPTEAVETTDTATEEQTDESQASAPVEDAELAEWASKKGLELDSDNARKAAKMAREAEKLAGRNGQRAGELEKTMGDMSDESAQVNAETTGQDPEVLKRVQRMEVKEAIRDFWDSNPGAFQYQAQMADIATNLGLSGSPEAILQASYAIAQSKDTTTVKSQAKKDTLSELAHKQQAAVPTGSATNRGTPKEKPFADLSIKEMEQRLGYHRI